jgi:hypothetical protein
LSPCNFPKITADISLARLLLSDFIVNINLMLRIYYFSLAKV